MTDIFEGQYPLEQVGHLIRTCRTSSGGGFLVADVDHRIPGYADRARRIVACLNACAGLDTEALEAGGVGCVAISKTGG